MHHRRNENMYLFSFLNSTSNNLIMKIKIKVNLAKITQQLNDENKNKILPHIGLMRVPPFKHTSVKLIKKNIEKFRETSQIS